MTGKEEGTVSCYATTVLKNLNWPGFYLVASVN